MLLIGFLFHNLLEDNFYCQDYMLQELKSLTRLVGIIIKLPFINSILLSCGFSCAINVVHYNEVP